MSDMSPERREELIELARKANPGDEFESDEERVFSLICQLVELNVQQGIESASPEHTVLEQSYETAMLVDAVLENVVEEGWKVTRR